MSISTMEKAKEVAREIGIDVFPDSDPFSEGGWGVILSFDLAEALSTYLPLYWSSQYDEKYATYCGLFQAPILYHNPYGGIESPSAFILMDIMEGDKDIWKEYYDLLVFLCQERNKKEGRVK